MNSNWGHAYANGFLVLAEGFEMLTLGAIAPGGKNLSSNLSSTKRNFVGRMTGSLTQNDVEADACLTNV
jgi:hypothetical protein